MKTKIFLSSLSGVAMMFISMNSGWADTVDTSEGGQCEGGGNYAEAVFGEEASKTDAQYSTNPNSTATGSYQFLYGTLGELGYIDLNTSSRPAFGKGNWSNVNWTGKDGIWSRQQFMDSMDAQNNALSEFTQRNLDAISGSYTPGQVVNGVPMSDGGAALASHFLGAGAFNTWAKSGFTTAGLDAGIAADHGWSLEQMQNHLMGRIAKGGCYDPGLVETTEGMKAEGVPRIYLMPWEPKTTIPTLLPGSITSTI